MPEITIDGRKVEVSPGSTVLDAARTLGIGIPTLCHAPGLPLHTSCMLCAVRDVQTRRLVPSCSLPARDGMEFASDAPDVREARQKTLELLLGEHVGDCEAPCQRSCPAQMNIPLMIRQIGSGKTRDALITVKRDIALPAVLGRICPAPCEKACRRGRRDQPVAICLLKRFAGDVDLAGRSPWLPERRPATDKEIAIIGAGPAGLAAAWHLALDGHVCTVFDDHDQPGGALRHAVPEDRLPRDVLDKEIAVIRQLGVNFRLSCRVGVDIHAGELPVDFDAVVLATGPSASSGLSELASHLGIELAGDKVKVDPATFQASRPGIFAAGSVVHPSQMAVRAVAHGRAVAAAVHQFLSGQPVTGLPRRFNSVLGKLEDGEMQEFMKGAADHARLEPAGGTAAGFSEAEAAGESARCMHCDCRKADDCRLRLLAEYLEAKQGHFRVEGRLRFERIQQPGVVYEPGKCIECGICVRICEKQKERLGLTFIGRGFQVRVGVPFNRPLSEALEHTAADCIAACPTGALAGVDA